MVTIVSLTEQVKRNGENVKDKEPFLNEYIILNYFFCVSAMAANRELKDKNAVLHQTIMLSRCE